MRQRFERGMTLMELLVAMVIGSLVIALVVRGLGLSLNLYERVASITSSMDVRFRESQWWSDSIASLVPCTDLKHCVKGNSAELTGYTFAPILDDGGKRTPVTWKLIHGPQRTALTYIEGSQDGPEPLQMSILLPDDAEFAYLYPDKGWVNEWNSGGDNSRLPAAVKIQDLNGDIWAFGATAQRPYGREDYRDMLEAR